MPRQRCARRWNVILTTRPCTCTLAIFTPNRAGLKWPQRNGKNRWQNGSACCRLMSSRTKWPKWRRKSASPGAASRKRLRQNLRNHNVYMAEVRIPALAKINLHLEVIGKRPDDYHELRTIFQSISLQDEIRLKSTREPGITLEVLGNDSLSSEPIEKNLVHRAVCLLRQELMLADGVAIELRKVIPAGRGLGGGSSDAAAA